MDYDMKRAAAAYDARVTFNAAQITVIAIIAAFPAYITTTVSWVLIAIALVIIEATPIVFGVACTIVAIVNYTMWFIASYFVSKHIMEHYNSHQAGEEECA